MQKSDLRQIKKISCLGAADVQMIYLSHQEREALSCKLANVLLLVCQQCAVQAVEERRDET